jgi:hypothetical protein
MGKISHRGVACYNVNVKLGRSELSDKTGLLVLETNHQPDYYSRANFPPNKHQSNWRLFLIVKKHIDCFQDVVLKKAYQINKALKTDMEIMPGFIDYNGKRYQSIRINLSDTSLLEKVIKELESINVVFLTDKKTKDYETTVFFKRYTELVEMKEDVYKDSRIPGHYFFPIDNIIEFDEFEKGIVRIKNGCNFHMFDSFLSFMFVEGGRGQDFIGIYSEHCDESRFDELKKLIKNTFDV